MVVQSTEFLLSVTRREQFEVPAKTLKLHRSTDVLPILVIG